MNLPGNSKKFLIGTSAIIFLSTLVFLGYFFLQKGTVQITSQAPFSVEMIDMANFDCHEEKCQFSVRPGSYTMILKKKGYREISLPVVIEAGVLKEEKVEFEFIPVLKKISSGEKMQVFDYPNIKSRELPNVPIFYDASHVVYLARNPDNRRQTLYVRSFSNNTVTGSPKAVTSFMRDIQKYIIIPSIHDNQKIALIDNTYDQSILYIIDLQAKSRQNILTYPFIKDLKWIPESPDFLFEGRSENGSTEDIFLYESAKKTSEKLQLRGSLKNIIIPEKSYIITVQLQNSDNDEKIVTFLKFDLFTRVSKTIFSMPALKIPEILKLNDDKKRIFFIIGENFYELQLKE